MYPDKCLKYAAGLQLSAALLFCMVLMGQRKREIEREGGESEREGERGMRESERGMRESERGVREGERGQERDERGRERDEAGPAEGKRDTQKDNEGEKNERKKT